VEQGISYLRSFKQIIIHPRCKGTIEEFKNYSYKKDKHTDEILPVIVDKYNHAIDALRYSISPYITKRVNIFDLA
jgi:phage terminase large subunit